MLSAIHISNGIVKITEVTVCHLPPAQPTPTFFGSITPVLGSKYTILAQNTSHPYHTQPRPHPSLAPPTPSCAPPTSCAAYPLRYLPLSQARPWILPTPHPHGYPLVHPPHIPIVHPNHPFPYFLHLAPAPFPTHTSPLCQSTPPIPNSCTSLADIVYHVSQIILQRNNRYEIAHN